MSSLLFDNTLQAEVNQMIPVQLRYKKDPSMDVILSREKIRVTPLSSASTYGGGFGTQAGVQGLLKFRLVSDAWLDMQTLRLRGNASVTADNIANIATAYTLAPVGLVPAGDGISSVFKNVRTLLGSNEFENIENYNVLFGNVLPLCSMPEQYYKKQATLEGCFKNLSKSPRVYDNAITLVDATDAASGSMTNSNRKNQFNPKAYAMQLWNVVVDAAGVATGGFDFSCPLHLAITRTGTFLPPRVPIDIEITMEDVNVAFAKVNAPTNYAYLLNNLYLTVDQLQVHPSYQSKYMEVINADGLTMECDVYAKVANPTGASTTATLNISRGVSRLRSMYSVMMVIANAGTAENNLCTFLPNNFKSIRYVINGRSYPSSNGIVGFAEAYDALQQSLGHLNDLNATSMLDFNAYSGQNYGWRGANTEVPQFVLGQDFQKADSRASGVDTAVQGGLITIQLEATGNMTASTLHTWLHFDRGIMIKSDGIVVSE